ncbi:MAG TPA: polysaccharide pyruvyl transferase family protein [Nocardioidaceae bacterium]|nr:polysaccharide pyruvyl transferase family protein [Nocardioidaceae bacterium]
MPARRIYLVASAGYPNYGDELITAQWLRYLAKREPDAEVWLDSPNPGGATLLFAALHPDVRFTDTLFRIAWAAPSEDFDEVAHFAADATRNSGVVPHRAMGVELLHIVDVFHILGGGYINTIWPRHIALLAAGSVLTEERGILAAASGLGLVPWAQSTELLNRLTTGFSVFDVRDAESRALLSGENASDTGDDALLDIGPHLYDQRDTRSLMMSFQTDLVDVSVDSLADSALQTVQAWGVDSKRIGYVEGIPGQDRRVFELLESSLPGMQFYPFTEVWREGLPARRGQRWLTTRFHQHLMAAAVGAWGVVFPVKPGYYDVKHQSLISRGSRWAVAKPGEPAPQAHGEAGFGPALAPLVSAKQELAARIYGG